MNKKLYEISYVNHDTCGNSWGSDKPSEYVLAENIKKVWTHINKPNIVRYWTKDCCQNKYQQNRSGEVIIRNEFNSERDFDEIYAMECTSEQGFSTIVISLFHSFYEI